MLTVYWLCLAGGLVFALLTVLLGDVVDGALEGIDLPDDLLDPLSFVGGLSVFGGAGILLTEFAPLGPVATGVLAAGFGFVLAVAMHFGVVKPMKRAEASTGFSVREYAGKLGEVSVAVPATGFGEVVVQMGASRTFQTAASFDGSPIPTGTRVVVVEVGEEALLVSPFDRAGDEPAALPRMPAQLGA